MKIFKKLTLISLTVLLSNSLYSQVGINTTTPDPSSVLELVSNNKGFLMTRLTTTERDNIIDPANGLMIYNTTLNDSQINTGTSSAPDWIGIKGRVTPIITSVTEADNVTTTSNVNLAVPGMTITTASSGIYLVLFNGHMTSINSQEFTSTQAIIDVQSLYNQLSTFPGGSPHALVFGNGETLQPGVYDISGAMSIEGTLTLDGGSINENPVFIMRAPGAFATGAGSVVNLTGNAKPENIFWVSDGAPSTGANSSLSGTLIHGSAAAGAVSMGASTTLNGRLFTTLGAASVGAGCVLTVPNNEGPFNLGVLSTFAMWTSNGAITSEAGSTITGNVGTGSGSTAGMLGTVNGNIYQAGTTATITTPTATTFSIFQNGTEVPNSSRIINASSAVISLQTMVTANVGESTEVRWKIADGTAVIDNRILTLIPSGF